MTSFASTAFKPHFRGDNVIHSLFMLLQALYYRIKLSVSMRRCQGIIYVLYCSVMYEWWSEEWRRKKSRAGISLLLPKITERVARLNNPIRRTNRHQQYICLRTTHMHGGGIWDFIQGIFGTETSGWSFVLPCLLVSGKIFLYKNSYSYEDQTPKTTACEAATLPLSQSGGLVKEEGGGNKVKHEFTVRYYSLF